VGSGRLATVGDSVARRGADEVGTERVHGYGPRCHTCDLGIEMRYSGSGPRSKSQGYWSHQDTIAGIAADLKHDALR
jgi:hypothetical protein